MYRHRRTRCGPGDAATSSPLDWEQEPPNGETREVMPIFSIPHCSRNLCRASSVMLRTARLWGTGRLVPVLTRQSHPRLHHSAVTRSLLWPTPRAAAAAAAGGPRLAVLRATGFPRRTLAMGGNRFVKVVPSTMNPWLRRAL